MLIAYCIDCNAEYTKLVAFHKWDGKIMDIFNVIPYFLARKKEM